MSTRPLKITVGIATFGRRRILSSMLDVLAAQTRLPDQLIICRTNPQDVDEEALKQFKNVTLSAPDATGTCCQRNHILSLCGDTDVIVFLDDDFFPERDYLKFVEDIFASNPDVGAATGTLIDDGATGPGIDIAAGLEMVRAAPASSQAASFYDFYGTYGCNMAFRVALVSDHKILFDENLPLYGWQEDIDFSITVARYGRTVKSPSLRGVHLGVKMGRTSGIRLGYSQIANPIYLVEKGTMSRRHALKLMWRNVAANLVKSFHQEPWIDRRGRLRGNILAMLDLAKGRSSPNRILQLD